MLNSGPIFGHYDIRYYSTPFGASPKYLYVMPTSQNIDIWNCCCYRIIIISFFRQYYYYCFSCYCCYCCRYYCSCCCYSVYILNHKECFKAITGIELYDLMLVVLLLMFHLFIHSFIRSSHILEKLVSHTQTLSYR